MKREPILGIPCNIRSARVRRAIAHVLRAVRRHPRDWARLRRRVREFRFLGSEDTDTMGQWIQDEDHLRRLCEETGEDPRLWARQGEEEYLASGWVEVSRRAWRLPWPHLVALVAHECGHAVTRAREFENRQRVSRNSEWSSELCADRHAFRWGFEREIRAHSKHRRLAHHAVMPGDMIWCGPEAFIVDQHFFLRRRPAADDSPERYAEVIKQLTGHVGESAAGSIGRTRSGRRTTKTEQTASERAAAPSS